VSAEPRPVQYEVVHTTEYNYSESVAVSHHMARLSPRVLPHQQRLDHELQIEPAPGSKPGAPLMVVREGIANPRWWPEFL